MKTYTLKSFANIWISSLFFLFCLSNLNLAHAGLEDLIGPIHHPYEDGEQTFVNVTSLSAEESPAVHVEVLQDKDVKAVIQKSNLLLQKYKKKRLPDLLNQSLHFAKLATQSGSPLAQSFYAELLAYSGDFDTARTYFQRATAQNYTKAHLFYAEFLLKEVQFRFCDFPFHTLDLAARHAQQASQQGDIKAGYLLTTIKSLQLALSPLSLINEEAELMKIGPDIREEFFNLSRLPKVCEEPLFSLDFPPVQLTIPSSEEFSLDAEL